MVLKNIALENRSETTRKSFVFCTHQHIACEMFNRKVLCFSTCRQVACANRLHFLSKNVIFWFFLAQIVCSWKIWLWNCLSLSSMWKKPVNWLVNGKIHFFNRVTNCKMFVLIKSSLKVQYMCVYCTHTELFKLSNNTLSFSALLSDANYVYILICLYLSSTV